MLQFLKVGNHNNLINTNINKGIQSIAMDNFEENGRRRNSLRASLPLLNAHYSSDFENLSDEQIYKKVVNKFRENAEDGDEFDIYMVTSFLKYYHPNDPSSKWVYAFYCLKSIVCALIQTLGMVAFFHFMIQDELHDHLECRMEAEWDIKTVAVLFSLYISVSVVNNMRELRNRGVYGTKLAYLPTFMANEWVYLGLYCNAFSLMAATYGSFLLIYTSDSTIDIVLNSVALYFILEVDDELVGHHDYLRIEHWMKNEYKHEDYYSAEHLAEIKYTTICGMKLQTSGRKGGCNSVKLVWIFFGGILVYVTIIIGLIGAVIAPIALAVCY